MIIGSHVSFGKEQIYNATKEAISYGANTFMIYTGAPQNTVRSEINIEYLNKAKELIGKEVKISYGERVGLYSTSKCHQAPIEKIEEIKE